MASTSVPPSRSKTNSCTTSPKPLLSKAAVTIPRLITLSVILGIIPTSHFLLPIAISASLVMSGIVLGVVKFLTAPTSQLKELRLDQNSFVQIATTFCMKLTMLALLAIGIWWL